MTVSAIVESLKRAPQNAGEAAAVLAGFKLAAENTKVLHTSYPGAGDGNSRLPIDVTNPISCPFKCLRRH
jgi:hypothetical protein